MVYVQPARPFCKDYWNACICFSTQAGSAHRWNFCRKCNILHSNGISNQKAMKQNKMNINKINPAIRIAMALPLLALMVWSWSELGTPVSSKETVGSSLTEQDKQEPEAVAQDTLFTIALDKQINEVQDRMITVRHIHPTTTALHSENFVND